MELMYASTRDANEKVTASQAILKGLANDGGLYVPTEIPSLDVSMEELSKMTYQETAYEVLKLFLTDYTEEELKNCINAAYDSKFDTEEIAPLVDADGAYYLELFHGPTIAFKDMALSILPHLLITAARKNNVKNDIVILTATSGDTGKAALAGFADVKGTKIIVFYPKNGVSPVQEKQMVTQKGDNTFVVGIHGNFDQAQTGVKKMFSDKELAELKEHLGVMKASMTQKNPNVDEVFEIDNKFHDMIADMGHNAMVLKINAITRVLTHSTRYYSVKGMLESGRGEELYEAHEEVYHMLERRQVNGVYESIAGTYFLSAYGH